MAKSTDKQKSVRSFKCVVVPDKLDLRDRMYQPSVVVAPREIYQPKIVLPVLHQGDTNACTGFALANVVNFLIRNSQREGAGFSASPYMLYSMARRYDEFPGSKDDSGSSVRGAMKGWYKHGVCDERLWQHLTMPEPTKDPLDDWWLDAAKRPLGAYYRIDTRSVTDMQIALNEVGVLYASVVCHAGWDEGMNVEMSGDGYWMLPERNAKSTDGGHAIIIIGYNRDGFIIQNSWGKHWGDRGRAVLGYEDWLNNAMDCWVAQLGVPTNLHTEIAHSSSLRVETSGSVKIASDPILRNREIAPFVIDMENNGRLSHSGTFRTYESDIRALVNQHALAARETFGLADTDTMDVAIYAHGGLVGEADAADTFSTWIQKLYPAKIFPIFLMWETDLLSTIINRAEDAFSGVQRATGSAIGDAFKRFWNTRIERLLSHPGTSVWGEMKQNAEAISSVEKSGGRLLFEYASNQPVLSSDKVRLHLIGHSAGSIVHSKLIKQLSGTPWKISTVSFMAPAVTIKTFQNTVIPSLNAGTIQKYHQFHLTVQSELTDPTCKPILGYSRSLLYLVSESFEGGVKTPILGLKEDFDRSGISGPNIHVYDNSSGKTTSSTHPGFSEDSTTIDSVVNIIKSTN